jgi:hypothetical protein
MTLPDDETLAEEALKDTSDIVPPHPPQQMVTTTVPLESGMETGQGADDEPELAIGDRHIADAEPVSPDEARRLLGGEDG